LIPASIVATVIATAIPATAGGSVWLFDEPEYRPGDIAESTTSVNWGFGSSLGTPEEGPYLIYLAPIEASAATWPGIPEGAMLVGIVEVHLGPYRAEDGFLVGPHHAVARIEIPDVAPGEYQIFHCNDLCTRPLGDIIGGWGIHVVAGSGGRPPAEIAAEVRMAMVDHPIWIDDSAASAEPGGDWPIVAIALSLLVALVSGFMVFRRPAPNGEPGPEERENDSWPIESERPDLVETSTIPTVGMPST
jgi:hypothetical protein